MRVWKKLTVIALALMLVLAFGAVASAEGEATLSSGVAAGTNNAAISSSVIIPKSITVEGSGSKVYGPNVSYTYDIAPATVPSGTSVNDGTNSGVVKAGVANGVTLSTAEFTSSEVTLTSGSGTVTANVTATVDLTKFSAPGIYRYAITENSGNATALTTAGVTRSGSGDSLYLDVYIKNGDSGSAVYGFVLLSANESITASTASQYKVSAFTTDTYTTKDISVTKVVTGDMGDKAHEFPFAITVSNSGLNFYSGEGTASATGAATTALSANLKNGDTFVIVGLNPTATVTFVETNDTVDGYTVTITSGSGNSATSITGTTGTNDSDQATMSTGALPVANHSAITFTNNLDAISPTGVVLRYAPYLAMMGAGIVALPLSLRKKEELD